MTLDLPIPAALHMSLPDGGARRLEELAALLDERGVPLGLVSHRDRERIWERHILDCLRVAAEVGVEDRDAYDLGSGAGLPGLVVAIARPDLAVGLVEVRRRRAAFLELAIERMEIANARVIVGRVEDPRNPVDVCFARALAPLTESWRLAVPLLRPGGRLVYFAGKVRAPRSLPGASRVRIVASSVLESGGPLVIMTR